MLHKVSSEDYLEVVQSLMIAVHLLLRLVSASSKPLSRYLRRVKKKRNLDAKTRNSQELSNSLETFTVDDLEQSLPLKEVSLARLALKRLWLQPTGSHSAYLLACPPNLLISVSSLKRSRQPRQQTSTCSVRKAETVSETK